MSQKMVIAAGLEPATSRLEISRSIQMSYGARFFKSKLNIKYHPVFLLNAFICKICGIILRLNFTDFGLYNGIVKIIFFCKSNSIIKCLKTHSYLTFSIL